MVFPLLSRLGAVCNLNSLELPNVQDQRRAKGPAVACCCYPSAGPSDSQPAPPDPSSPLGSHSVLGLTSEYASTSMC